MRKVLHSGLQERNTCQGRFHSIHIINCTMQKQFGVSEENTKLFYTKRKGNKEENR